MIARLRIFARRVAVLTGTAILIFAAVGCGNVSGSSHTVPASTSPAIRAAPAGALLPPIRLPGWRRVFADDFTQDVPLGSFPSAVSASWFAYRDGLHDTSTHGVYRPSTVVSIANGMMNFHVHTDRGVHAVAAVLPVIAGAHGHEGGLLYGRYMIRLRSDAIPGYKASMVLWPDSETWPKDGEIDFPEAILGGPILGFVHYQNGVNKVDQAGFATTAAYTTWHTATITWLPHDVQFQLDRRIVDTVMTRIPNTPMHVIIQIETDTGGPAPASSSAGNVQIAWVAAFTPSCNPGMSISTSRAACTG